MSLFPHASRFIMLTVAAAVALQPSLPSQTPKELIGEACYNELQHRERKTLWSYNAERHNHDHVFREQVIETVDGPVRHLLAVDGHPPTSAQMKEEDDRHQELLKNPSGTRAIRKHGTTTTRQWKNFCALFLTPLFLRIGAKRESPKESRFIQILGSSPRPTSNACCMLWMG
jgi:hypothetical protein